MASPFLFSIYIMKLNAVRRIKASRIIPHLNEAALQRVREKLLKKVRTKKPEPWSQWRDSLIYWFGDKQNGQIILVYKEEILYFVRYREIKHGDILKFGRQILVWRKAKDSVEEATQTLGFPKEIFFKVLLPRYGALIGDVQQSPDGARFWYSNMQKALAQGHKYKAYYLDKRAWPNRLVQITSDASLQKATARIWGSARAHELVVPIIADKPLVIQKGDN